MYLLIYIFTEQKKVKFFEKFIFRSNDGTQFIKGNKNNLIYLEKTNQQVIEYVYR